ASALRLRASPPHEPTSSSPFLRSLSISLFKKPLSTTSSSSSCNLKLWRKRVLLWKALLKISLNLLVKILDQDKAQIVFLFKIDERKIAIHEI
ncbi:unnamed protein product, partial [Prunus brigantina]